MPNSAAPMVDGVLHDATALDHQPAAPTYALDDSAMHVNAAHHHEHHP